MALIVQKYGGTSVGSIERIIHVAKRAIRTKKEGHQVVVVVSAMAKQTDALISLAKQIDPSPNPRELDSLVSTGEQVSSALLAMAISKFGIPAISLLGHQVRILTDESHTKARILDIDGSLIKRYLRKNHIAVIAGFQGTDPYGNITTLGRGGSDTSAVAIAIALKANLCEIYTDVDGVFTADPTIVPNAKLIPQISFEEMLELSSLGAKVLQLRSVELAMAHNMPILVRNSFNDHPGTIVKKETRSMEKVIVSGVTSNKKESLIYINHLPNIPGLATQIFSPIAEKNISVNTIVQNLNTETNTANISFTLPEEDVSNAIKILKNNLKKYPNVVLTTDKNIALVSIVGVGMKSHSGVAAKMFQILATNKINIHLISTSEIKISCVIDRSFSDKAVKALHDGFKL